MKKNSPSKLIYLPSISSFHLKNCKNAQKIKLRASLMILWKARNMSLSDFFEGGSLPLRGYSQSEYAATPSAGKPRNAPNNQFVTMN